MPHDPGRSTPDSAHNDASNEQAQGPGEAIAHEAWDEANSVASTAQHEAGRVAEEIRDQTRDLALDARDEIKRQAEQQVEHLGHSVGEVGVRMQALADGRPEDAGRVQEVTSRIADQVQELGQRMEERGLEGTLDELQRFARRRPGMFLAGAAVVGFAASRMTRGVTDDSNDDGNSDSRGSGRNQEVTSQPPPLPAAAVAGDRTAVLVPAGAAPTPGTGAPSGGTDPVPGRMEP